MIKVICVGKLKEKYWIEAVNEYLKRLSKYTKIELIELNDSKIDDPLISLKQEKDFFDGIPDKLGYRQKEEKNNNLLNNAVEATKVSTKIGTIAIMENSIEKQMNEQNLEVKNV